MSEDTLVLRLTNTGMPNGGRGVAEFSNVCEPMCLLIHKNISDLESGASTKACELICDVFIQVVLNQARPDSDNKLPTAIISALNNARENRLTLYRNKKGLYQSPKKVFVDEKLYAVTFAERMDEKGTYEAFCKIADDWAPHNSLARYMIAAYNYFADSGRGDYEDAVQLLMIHVIQNVTMVRNAAEAKCVLELGNPDKVPTPWLYGFSSQEDVLCIQEAQLLSEDGLRDAGATELFIEKCHVVTNTADIANVVAIVATPSTEDLTSDVELTMVPANLL
eukprot:gene24661-14836_t